MFDIKELTKEQHKNAERQAFVKILMSGKIHRDAYATYLYNQLQCYSKLELEGRKIDLFKQTPGLERSEAIYKDYKQLWKYPDNPPRITESTKEYIEHIDEIKEHAEKMYAHIYVRHMGDLRGGQMIRKKVPGAGRYYNFTTKQMNQYSDAIRELVNGYLNVYQINVVAEARYCFESATKLFVEMKEMYDLGYFD